MLLVLPHDQIVRLEQQTLYNLQGVPAPLDKVTNVIPREERLRLSSGKVLHFRNIDQIHRLRQVSRHRLRHDLLRLLLLDVLGSLQLHRISVLQKKQK